MATETFAGLMQAQFGTEGMKRPVSRREFYEFMDDMIDKLGAATGEVSKRVAELEKSGARYRGVYQRASAYRRGDQATHKSSLWTALSDVPEGAVPGESSAHWQLAAKGTG